MMRLRSFPRDARPKHSAVTRGNQKIICSHGKSKNQGKRPKRRRVPCQKEQRNRQCEKQVEQGHDILLVILVHQVTHHNPSRQSRKEQSAGDVRSLNRRVPRVPKEQDELLNHGSDGPDGERAAGEDEPEVCGSNRSP